jgi:hypothetical protein
LPEPVRQADLRPAPPAPPPEGVLLPLAEPPVGAALEPGRRTVRWMRPAAWIAGGIAVGFAGLAVERRIAANDAYDSAASLLGPGDSLASSTDLGRYRSLTSDGDAAVRTSWISLGASVVLTAAAGLLGWGSAQATAPAAF